jgi:hypothetical protein
MTNEAKNQRKAALLTFLFPGLGQLYFGETFRAICVFLAFTLISLFYDGRVFLPVAAFLAAAELWRRKRSAQENKNSSRFREAFYIFVGVIGFLGWSLLFVSHVYPLHESAMVNDQVEVLADRVRSYRASHGNFPKNVQELFADETQKNKEGKDPWGNWYQISEDENGFIIRSLGRAELVYRFR